MTAGFYSSILSSSDRVNSCYPVLSQNDDSLAPALSVPGWHRLTAGMLSAVRCTHFLNPHRNPLASGYSDHPFLGMALWISLDPLTNDLSQGCDHFSVPAILEAFVKLSLGRGRGLEVYSAVVKREKRDLNPDPPDQSQGSLSTLMSDFPSSGWMPQAGPGNGT